MIRSYVLYIIKGLGSKKEGCFDNPGSTKTGHRAINSARIYFEPGLGWLFLTGFGWNDFGSYYSGSIF